LEIIFEEFISLWKVAKDLKSNWSEIIL